MHMGLMMDGEGLRNAGRRDPIYEYAVRGCGARFEALVRGADLTPADAGIARANSSIGCCRCSP